MKVKAVVLLFCGLALVLGSCSIKHEGAELVEYSGMEADGSVKMRVADVSNETGEVIPADVIGMCWDALEATLHKRGLRWTGKSDVRPLAIEAEVVDYRMGHALIRSVVPYLGDTELTVRCRLLDGDRVLYTAESTQSVDFMDGPNMGAWRGVFEAAAADVVNQFEAGLAGQGSGSFAQLGDNE